MLAALLARRLTRELVCGLARELALRLARELACRLACELTRCLAYKRARRLARELARRLARERARRLARELARCLARVLMVLTGSISADIFFFAFALWERFCLLLLLPFIWCPFSELSSPLDSSVPSSSDGGCSLRCLMDSRFQSSAKASSSRLFYLLSWALISAIS